MIAARFSSVLLAVFFAHSFAASSFAAPSETTNAGRASVQIQSASDISAQQRRVRPRVRVYPQPPFWEYPRPGTYSYPGPNAKRDCRAWYVIENRPSGAVMTPRMRCEWVRG